MKSLILNLFYITTLLFAVPWLVWRRLRYGKNRRGWTQKLFGTIPERSDARLNQDCVWLHAVSVGEVNLLSTMIERLVVELPGWKFAISTSTETGYDLACKKYPEHQVFFCPLDLTWAIGRVLDRLNPSMVVLAELEVWPNLTRLVKLRNIPLAIVNGRLSSKSYSGYRRIGWLMRSWLSRFDLIASQTDTYSKRFRELGAKEESLYTTGNVKFDGAQRNRQNSATQALCQVAGIATTDFVFVAGSTQPEEDRIAVDVWSRLVVDQPELRLILVPRHPENVGQIESYLQRMSIAYSLRSQLKSGSSEAVLIVDTVGELGSWWGRADVAYVGGSMGSRGGQNMIEPAAYGIPLCFGPNTRNFKDVTELLLHAKAAEIVRDEGQMYDFVYRSLSCREWGAELGKRAQVVVLDQQGAADRTVGLLLGLLEGQQSPRRQRADAA